MPSSYYWTSALGEKKLFSEIDHQHLSNILWFNEVFDNRNRTRYNEEVQFLLELELSKRFSGKYDLGIRLSWKPLPIPNEIRWIKKITLIDSSGNIYYKGSCIGSISHIPNWEIL